MKRELIFPEPREIQIAQPGLAAALKAAYPHKSVMDIYHLTGILPEIGGGAKGFNQEADFLFTTVDGYDLNEIWSELAETVRILNAQRNTLVQRLAFPVQQPIESVMQITGDEFEEADEFGEPKGIRLGVPFNMGFSLKYFDLAIRYTFRFLGTATREQIEALNNSALEADNRLQFKVLIDRIFDNTNATAVLRSGKGSSVNVYAFYNNDGTVPPGWKTYTHASTHTHYLVSGGATVTSANLDTMEDHIHHHGYTQSGAELILLVNREQSNTIQTFTIVGGARHDFIPKAGIAWRGTLVGQAPTDPTGLGSYPGFVGMYGRIAVVEEDYLPAKYMFLFASAGLFADRNPVGIREHENAALRGLKLFPGNRNEYPLIDSFYHHALGSGIRHRGAGVVMQIKASGSYDIPTLSYQGPGGR